MGKEEATRKLFGTDGIRGTANQYPMTAEVALSLGRTVTERLRLPGRRCRVVIGKDTRLGAGPLCGQRAQGPGHDRRHR